jgi:hypothetical protein
VLSLLRQLGKGEHMDYMVNKANERIGKILKEQQTLIESSDQEEA